MALTPGTRIGSYQVTAAIGQGGMGQVFRARDTKLQRDVALKVLPDSFAHDAERVARFTREAQTLAALNHPNIAAIYGVAEAGGTTALVMELVEGDDLARRITRGAIPLDEALPIARQIAEALEAAHEQGIVHRDLKPANIKVRPDGTVKVLDFGLAKAMTVGRDFSPAGGGAKAPPYPNSPTITSPAVTQAGIVLGTAAYMSPEQAKGRPADKRSDVWSFGCVLYEMLSGRRAFDAEDVSETLAAVLRAEPDWSTLPPDLPPALVLLLRKCLTKDRKSRIADISTARFLLDEPDVVGGLAASASGALPRPLWQRAMPLAAALVFAAIGFAAWTQRPAPSSPRLARFEIQIPADEAVRNTGGHAVAISPDGAHIVYAANQQLYLRSVAEMNARPIAGTAQGAEEPFFSPDGQWLGFYAATERKLKKIALSGGTALSICDADPVFGASWADDDRIVFGQGPKGIFGVSASGGRPDVLTSNAGEIAHGPQLLVGGKALLFTSSTGRGAGAWDSARVVIQDLATGDRKVVLEGASDARYLSSGHLVYTVGSTILAVPFDVRRLEATGGAVPVIDGVGRAPSGTSAASHFSVSNNGSLAYLPGAADSDTRGRTLALVDRAGSRTPLDLPPASYFQPRVSPDGRQLALQREGPLGPAIWIYDLTGSTPIRRLTFGGNEVAPLWTRDGQRVLYTSRGDDGTVLSWQRADGGGSPERLATVEAGTELQAEALTPDGRTLIVSLARGSDRRLARVDLGVDSQPQPLIPVYASNATLSPDGHWLAYISFDGRYQVSVQPFPPTGAKYQVSADGGRDPLWSPDGKQLFFMENRGLGWQLVAAAVTTSPALAFGKSTPLPIERVVAFGTRAYDITPDGRQFLVTVPPSRPNPDAAGNDQINVTLGWFEDLRQRVPTR